MVDKTWHLSKQPVNVPELTDYKLIDPWEIWMLILMIDSWAIPYEIVIRLM